jgi:hypothetical protein
MPDKNSICKYCRPANRLSDSPVLFNVMDFPKAGESHIHRHHQDHTAVLCYGGPVEVHEYSPGVNDSFGEFKSVLGVLSKTGDSIVIKKNAHHKVIFGGPGAILCAFPNNPKLGPLSNQELKNGFW